jgi:hypothetical protein
MSPLGAVTTPALVVAGDAGLAECHQQLPVGAELAYHMTGLDAGLGGGRDRCFGGGVGRPHVAFAINVQAVRPDEHLRAEALDHVALGVELVDRVVRLELAIGQHAIDAEATTACDRHRICLVAADEGPDALAIDVDMHRCGWAHLAAAGQSGPFAARNARAAAISEAAHRAVGVVSRTLREALRRQQQGSAPYRHPSSLKSHDASSLGCVVVRVSRAN